MKRIILLALSCLLALPSAPSFAWKWELKGQELEVVKGGTWIGNPSTCAAKPSDCGASRDAWFKATKGDDAGVCKSGYKYLCVAASSPYSDTFWWGDSPFCPSRKYCPPGYQIIARDRYGEDTGYCVWGRKVLCGLPK